MAGLPRGKGATMRRGRVALGAVLGLLAVALLVGAAAPKPGKAEKKPAEKPAAKPATKQAAKADGQDAEKPKRKVSVVEIMFHGAVAEQAAVAMPFGPQPKLLRDFTATIRKAATDEKIKAVILRIRQPALGLGKLQELMASIAELKAANKPVYCYLDACGNGAYLLATSADKIVAAPGGMVMLTGLSAQASFYKGLLDWAGVQAHMMAFGKHKSAGDPFTRDSMSEENRKVINEFLDDLYDQFVAAIAKGRKLDPKKVRETIDHGPYSANEARTFHLVDDVAYYDQFVAGIGKDLDGEVKLVRDYHRLGKKGPDLAQMNIFTLFAALQPKPAIPATKRPKVVIIYACGPITVATSSFMPSQVITAEVMGKAFEQARSDDTVKAVVLRIDSGGGSALVSDLIWHEVERTRKAGKPVVASMSDVAGSGGYYIAMNADAIVAHPATITGSIGVIGGKLSLRGLYDKIGIKKEVFRRGKNSAIFSDYTGFTPDERTRMHALMADIYTTFVHKAAEGRKMPVEKMRELATGRIWTARAAQKLGLVDQLGGLRDAFDLAVEKAGLKGKDVQPVILPREKSMLEAILAPMAQATSPLSRVPMPAPVLRTLPYLQVFELLARENVLALMPYTIEIQ